MGAEAYDVQAFRRARARILYRAADPAQSHLATFCFRADDFSRCSRGTTRSERWLPDNSLELQERDLTLYTPNESWLAVRKDLLDQQIIDTQGRKVVAVKRCGPAEQKTNGNVELRLTAGGCGPTRGGAAPAARSGGPGGHPQAAEPAAASGPFAGSFREF